MNLITQYREAFVFYAASAVVLTAVAIGTSNAGDHKHEPCCVHPIPSASGGTGTIPPSEAPSPGLSSTVTASPTPQTSPSSALVTPSSGTTTLPGVPGSTTTRTVTSTPLPSVSISISISASATVPVPTVPVPPPVRLPHNKANGLKDGCLVQKKKWLLKVPCPQAHHSEGMP